VALGLACTRPSPPSAPGGGSTVDAGTSLGCEGALALSIAVYAMPHGGEQRMSIASDGRLELTGSGSEGGGATCSAALSPSELRAFAERVAALRLHELPKKISAPFVRDGVTVVVEGRCGRDSLATTARNLFPSSVVKLMDLVDATLTTHCASAARLPTGAQLTEWSISTGATEQCARDCAACNSCSSP
jgi:hypothetical protein